MKKRRVYLAVLHRSNNTMKILSALLFIAINSFNAVFAQDTLSVLFLGNSYTAYNNLPQLVKSLSSSSGKTLITDWYTPGGMTISGHTKDPIVIDKINQGIWDYVIIQEQSQIPGINYLRYNSMYPALTELKEMVKKANPCARVITYITWGRRYGGQQCDPTNTYCSPVFSDFNHMQDSLTVAYNEISDKLNMQCAPVGVTWQNILNDTNLVLHSNDNSHPNADGSYVAALTIYSCIWKRPGSGNSYTGGLTASRAQYYQQMSDQTVFNGPDDWNLNINVPHADFSYSVSGKTVSFTNTSRSDVDTTLDYYWDFGDGNKSKVRNPTHSYASNGTYTARLIVTNCIFFDTVSYKITVITNGITGTETAPVLVYPNPASTHLFIDFGDVHVLHDCKLSMINSSGQTVFTALVTEPKSRIDLSTLPGSGVFLVQLKDSQGGLIVNRKLLISRE